MNVEVFKSTPKVTSIIWLTLVVEGFLSILFFVWHGESAFALLQRPNAKQFAPAIWLVLQLFAINAIIYNPWSRSFRLFREFWDFFDTVVKPFAENLSIVECLFISLCAGIGEELFFRGVLLGEVGVLLSSVAFALLHFGPSFRRYPLVLTLYFLMSVLFARTYVSTSSLWVTITAHALYDFGVLMFLRHLNRQMENPGR